MRLSRTERWILWNQYRILEGLYPREAESLCKVRVALERGYEFHYTPDSVCPDEDVMTVEECTEVLAILQMFSRIKSAYEALSDKSGIDEWRVKFAGFDGNHEPKQMAYARYFCGLDDGRYPELDRGDNFNSHRPMLDRYRAMHAEWERSAKQYELTKEDIIRITSAQ